MRDLITYALFGFGGLAAVLYEFRDTAIGPWRDR